METKTNFPMKAPFQLSFAEWLAAYGERLTEAKERRSEMGKVFQLGENHFRTVIYPEAVHYWDAANKVYDARNKPAVVTFNGTAYAYLYNLQGDVIALIDSNCKKVVEYKYDAWGRILSKTGTMASTLGPLNPFRYRGYVYDEETGLYYIQTRYYNPTWRRFLSADLIIGFMGQLLTHNQYTYCENNPVNYIDKNGFSRWIDLKWDYTYL